MRHTAEEGRTVVPFEPNLRAILDAMPLMFFLKDTENRILLANRAVAETLGVGPEALEGTPTAQWYPDEAEKYHQDDLQVIRSGRPKLGIVEPLNVAGPTKHWATTDKFPYRDGDGEVAGVLVFIRDATAQALAEAALRRSEEDLQRANAELKRVMDSISDGLWSVELDARGKIVSQFLSSGVERVSGLAAAALGDDPAAWLGHVHADDRARVREAALSLLAGSRAHRVEEYRVAIPGRPVRWLRDSATARRGADGHVRIDRVLTDVTERHAADEERRGYEERARHTQRLESLGILAGGIAHDFNNLLTGIYGYSELALDSLPPSSPAVELIEEIREAGRRAAAICEQMLAYSGRGRFQPRPIDLGTVIRGVARLVRTSISRRARLELRIEDRLPAIRAETAQLQQVAMNLILNASDALGEAEGTIGVSVSAVDCDRERLARSYVDDRLPAGRYVVLEVSDDGCGMPREVLERIFDPFFTTKIAGRGLGLAAALGIVRGHGGALEIRTEVGAGTAFRILFPAIDEPAEAEIAVGADRELRGHGLVLVVDDEWVVRRFARECLERAGFEVVTAADGARALALLDELPEPPAAALVDLTLPGQDGRDLLRLLRARRAALPAVLSSGFDEREVEDDPADARVAFLRKPYRAADLVRALLGAIGAAASAEAGN